MSEIFFYVIYERPCDFPHSYVCRRHQQLPWGKGTVPRDLVGVAHDLETIRQTLPTTGLMRVDRHPHDDPVIVETWL